MNYYSPELVRYIQGAAEPGELTQASDIFALGLIYAEYLTGAPPERGPGHHNAAIAVLDGAVLQVRAGSAPDAVRALVERMLLLDPAARPTVAEVHATLMGLRAPASTKGRAPLPAGSTRRPVRLGSGAAPGTATGTARGAAAPGAARPGPPAAVEPAPTPAAPGPSALRGKGLRLAAGAVRPRPDAPPAAPARGLLGKLLDRLEGGPR
jgi:hypothetical protein